MKFGPIDGSKAVKFQEIEAQVKALQNAPHPPLQERQPLANTTTGSCAKDVRIAALELALNKATTNDTTTEKRGGRNNMPDKGFGRERKVAQYPGSTAWCHSCGFDLYKTHNSETCRWPKIGHKREATVCNQMGGSQRNKHLYSGNN